MDILRARRDARVLKRDGPNPKKLRARQAPHAPREYLKQRTPSNVLVFFCWVLRSATPEEYQKQ